LVRDHWALCLLCSVTDCFIEVKIAGTAPANGHL
jgi:hypothetical protein